MMDHEKVNILLVDDQPAKAAGPMSSCLKELGENLVRRRLRAGSALIPSQERNLQSFWRRCMPELYVVELAAMILESSPPLVQKTAIDFHFGNSSHDLGPAFAPLHEMGAVDIRAGPG